MAAISDDERARLEALRDEAEESRRRYRELVDGLDAVVWEGDPDTGNFTFVSRQVERILGYTPEWWIEDPDCWSNILHPWDRERAVACRRAAMLGSKNREFEYRAVTADGRIIWLHESVQVIADAEGVPRQARGLIVDVTERRQSEFMLRESEKRFRNLFENAPIGIYRSTPDGRLLNANPALVRMLGFGSPEELLTQTIEQDWFPSEFPRQVFTEVIERDGEIRGLESVWKRVDGSTIIVSENARSVRGPDGNVMFYEGTVEDITERTLSRQALRESEERFRLMAANALDGIIMVDERGRIESYNLAAARIFGYEPDEAIGRQATALLVAVPEGQTAGTTGRLQQKALNRITEWEGRRRDGTTFPMELSLFDFQTPDGRHFAWTIRDISERREVDRLKKEFISTISHELRTPLTSIRGSLSLLAAGVLGDLSSDAFDAVCIAERNAIRLVALINDILDLERLENGRMEMHFDSVPLTMILEKAAESARGFARQHGVSLVLPETFLYVHADGDRIAQVLVNLFSNAIKFSPEGSQITVSIGQIAGWVEISVKDTGRGVPIDYQEIIFQRFQQVEGSDSRQKGGAGLGLAICKAIVEQHKGEIGVESTEGAGSTFWIRLPVITPPEQADKARLKTDEGRA